MTQTETVETPKKPTTLQALAAFFKRRTLVMLGLGFAAGMPYLLIFDTLSGWLGNEGVSISVIGFFGLATLAYSLKFVWAPLVDRTSIPFLTALVGHRRSWMLVTQILIMIGLWLISGSDPSANLWRVALFAVFVGFAGATQDIVIDAWRIEAAPREEQGVMATAYQWGYRGATLAAGFGAFALSDAFNWNVSYAVMTALMIIGLLAVFAAPRETQHEVRPIPVGDVPSRPVLEVVEWIARLVLIAIICLVIGSGLTGSVDLLASLLGAVGLDAERAEALKAIWKVKPDGAYMQVAAVLLGLACLVAACWPLPGVKTRPGAYLAGSFGVPLKDFFERFGRVAGLILALICLYRLADFVLNIMTPFYQQLGFSNTEIGEVRKLFGIVATMVGVTIAGFCVLKLGLIRTMVIGAFASPLSNLVFAWLATQGPDLPSLFIAIGFDNLATGFAGTALIAYMSSLTSVGFTATQYALFSSLYAFPGKLVSSQSGRIVEAGAHSAEAGGLVSGFKPLVANLPAQSFVEASQPLGVSPASLGAGYIAFFFYSTLIGIFAILLAFIVAGKHAALIASQETNEAAGKDEPQPSDA